jgi:hypothetical protein
MKAHILKQRIFNDNKIINILQALNMHHIKDNNAYISCGMPNGDNQNSTIIYKNEYLPVEAYTRNIKDQYGNSDIISLVSYIMDSYFINSIQWICKICNYDFYERDYKQPEFLKCLNELWLLNQNKIDEIENEELIPLNEDVLKYFGNYSNKLFLDDNIDDLTQLEFELGFDLKTNRITIPIRDEISTLLGVKGRLYSTELLDHENKYLYIYKCSKNQILYGLHKTLPYIKKYGIVYVAESEKAVMQGWSKGIKNVVSIGGHQLSHTQVKKLTHLGVDICLCYDDKADYISKEIDGEICLVKDKEFYQKERDKFLLKQKVYAIIDEHNKVLRNKESPFDRLDKWDELLKMKKLL